MFEKIELIHEYIYSDVVAYPNTDRANNSTGGKEPSTVWEQSELQREPRAISDPFNIEGSTADDKSRRFNKNQPADSTESSDEDPYLRQHR